MPGVIQKWIDLNIMGYISSSLAGDPGWIRYAKLGKVTMTLLSQPPEGSMRNTLLIR